MRIQARVGVHEILATKAAEIPDDIFGDDGDQPRASNTRGFGIDQHWLRGGYAPSLYADNDAASFRWRSDFLRFDLPALPTDRRGDAIDPALFWTVLAQNQGGQSPTVQRRLRLDGRTLEDCLRRAEVAQLLRRLTPWPSEKSDGRPRLYLRDSGLLHGLLGIRSLDRLGRWKGASWEGFAIEAMIGAAAPDAQTWVYRDADTDEIDVVFRTPRQTRPWAIEVKSAPRPWVSRGFHRGVTAIGAGRQIAVYRGGERRAVNAEVEGMSLVDVMRELQSL